MKLQCAICFWVKQTVVPSSRLTGHRPLRSFEIGQIHLERMAAVEKGECPLPTELV
jgi:hypothetical protein